MHFDEDGENADVGGVRTRAGDANEGDQRGGEVGPDEKGR